MEPWKTASAGVPGTAMVAGAAPGVSSSPAVDYLDRCGALAAAAAAGLSGMMLAVTSPPGLAAFSSCMLPFHNRVEYKICKYLQVIKVYILSLSVTLQHCVGHSYH